MFFIKKKVLKNIFILFSLLFTISNGYSDNWVLAAQSFSFKQQYSQSESYTQSAVILTQLILEKISSGQQRVLPEREIMNRELDELQTKRLSLLLQLSKEYQVRDTLVLTVLKPKELEKQLNAEKKKISEIEKNIADNLAEVEKVKNKHSEKIEREENSFVDDENHDKRGLRLAFPFFHHGEREKRTVEEIVLYKNDTAALFTPSESALEEGFDSWTYKKEVDAAKINGVLSGSITVYGDYVSVTVDLFVYPGAKSVATVTEVGSLANPMDLAERIVRSMLPKLANSLPVELVFDINPYSQDLKTLITIDDLVYTSVPEHVVLDAGIHTISIECAGYESVSTSYQFKGNEKYVIKTELVPEVKGVMNIRLKKYADGVFYSSGYRANEGQIQINGKAVMGVFIANAENDGADSSNKAFYYVPASVVKENGSVVVNAKPYDREKNIDKRRRHMYLAYSCLICSLPATFYCVGNFTAANNSYAGYSGDTVSFDEVLKWQKRSYICFGINWALGAWSIIELVRYLHAANEVLPANAVIDKKANFDIEEN